MNFQTYTINSIYEKEELFATLREFAQLLFSYAKSDLDDFFLLPCAKVKSQLVSAVQHELRREKRVKRLQLCTPSTLQSFA